MKGPAQRKKNSSSGTGNKKLNVNPSAPQNVRRLLESIESVMVQPARSYQKAWKRELDAFIEQFGLPQRHREASVPFDDFHPEATRAAALSMINPKKMKTYELHFDEISDQELPGLTKSYDELFVRIAKRFVDEEISVAFSENNKALEAIPRHITGMKTLIGREFQRLYDGRIKEALYRIKQESISLSLQRIRDAQLAGGLWV